ncbi:ALP1-like protein isoform X1 [Tanacetum coccineum]
MARPFFDCIADEVTNHSSYFRDNIDCTEKEAIFPLLISVMKKFGPEYLRKPMVTDVAKLYRHREEKHGFSGMLGSLGCMVWEWFGCPYTFKGQYVRCDHGSNPFILLEVVASQDL